MPIVIMPKRSKMDKMGGGGMDIGRTPPSPSKYAIPGISKNPALKKMKISHSNDAQMTDPKLGNRKSIQMTGKMEDMREYLDALDGIEEEMHSEDTVQESYYKDMMQDVEEGMTKEEFAKKYPGSKDEYDKIKKEIADMNESQVDQDTVEENYLSYFMGKPAMYRKFSDVDKGMTEEEFNKKYPRSKGEYAKIKKEIANMNESQVDEGKMKQAQIEVQDWADKFNKYRGTNGDPLANGYFEAVLNTGIMSDAYEENEVEAFNKMKGYPTDEIDSSWEDGDHEDFTENESGVSPITAAMFDGIGKILFKYKLEDETARDMIEGVSMENKDIEIEEDCGCEQEAVDEMITMPMQELADILKLAGYENYEEKIAEYANEPAENYMDPEEQLIGLSGGLNRPKKSYPASAPGDNPMDQEPREIEETVEQQLYKSYKDFLKAEEIKEKD